MSRQLLFLFLVVAFIASPVLIVGFAWFSPNWALLEHFSDALLWQMTQNTFWLLLGVAFAAGVLGTSLAWLVTMCEFPGRRWFELLFFLPFVMPAYVVAFVYLGLFDYSGPIQSQLRLWWPESFSGLDIRSGHWGIITVFTLVFYPYVYMLARVGFMSQRPSYLEASQMLGHGHWLTFWRITLPLARPGIVAGMALVMMETLADFGVVSIFNYDTFTTVIYSAWEDYRSVEVAAQIASLLVLLSFILILLEKRQRGQARFYADQCMIDRPFKLKGGRAVLAIVFSLIIVGAAFLIPVIELFKWTLDVWLWDDRYWLWVQNSVLLGLMAATLSVSVAILLLVIKYRTLRKAPKQSKMTTLAITIASMGYALPGSVMAIGILFVLAAFNEVAQSWFNINLLALMTSVGVLLYAYLSRFIAVAIGPIEGAMEGVHPSYVDAAQTLGAGKMKIATQVYLPLIAPGIGVAFLLVAVDVMKELPATYLLRPFGWETLSIRIYEMAAEGLYEQAAFPSLLLIIISLLFIPLAKRIERIKQ